VTPLINHIVFREALRQHASFGPSRQALPAHNAALVPFSPNLANYPQTKRHAGMVNDKILTGPLFIAGQPCSIEADVGPRAWSSPDSGASSLEVIVDCLPKWNGFSFLVSLISCPNGASDLCDERKAPTPCWRSRIQPEEGGQLLSKHPNHSLTKCLSGCHKQMDCQQLRAQSRCHEA
jgi:hypothetical protein